MPASDTLAFSAILADGAVVATAALVPVANAIAGAGAFFGMRGAGIIRQDSRRPVVLPIGISRTAVFAGRAFGVC